MCLQLYFPLMLMCRTTPYHLSHLILLNERVQYKCFTPFLKRQTIGGWFNLNEVLIRRERGNNTRSSLNIGLVLLATPSTLSHVGAKLAVLARRSGKTAFSCTTRRQRQAYFPTRFSSSLLKNLLLSQTRKFPALQKIVLASIVIPKCLC